nr:hypothetical protein [Tanacetum cinerariifolium]
MRDEHLSTTLETKSDKIIKSSVKNLVPIPNHSEILSDSNDDDTSNDDNAFEDIEFVEASVPNSELFSLKEAIYFSDNSIPLGIENIDHDSEGDIYFLEELLSNDSIPLLKNKSSNFDHHNDPSFPRPPSKLPDVEVFFEFEPDSGELISAVMNNIDELNEDECFDPGGGEIDVFANVEDDDYFPFIFVI